MGEESAFLQTSKKLLCSQAGKSCVLCSSENTHFFRLYYILEEEEFTGSASL